VHLYIRAPLHYVLGCLPGHATRRCWVVDCRYAYDCVVASACTATRTAIPPYHYNYYRLFPRLIAETRVLLALRLHPDTAITAYLRAFPHSPPFTLPVRALLRYRTATTTVLTAYSTIYRAHRGTTFDTATTLSLFLRCWIPTTPSVPDRGYINTYALPNTVPVAATFPTADVGLRRVHARCISHGYLRHVYPFTYC